MIFKSKLGFSIQNLREIAFRIILFTIGLIGIGQTYWLIPRHFTQIDDVGVAESLLVRNMDYRDDCLKNLKEIRGKTLLFITQSPDFACRITTKLNRLTIVPSLWTYAPIQFWLTQAFLSPKHQYNYEDVKYWGRLPSYIFYVVGVLGFYLLVSYFFSAFSKRPTLAMSMTVLLSLSLEGRIHAAQMHSYAIGILANVLPIIVFLKITNLNKISYWLLFLYGGVLAISIGMQYQAILLVLACLIAVFICKLLVDRCIDSSFVGRYFFLFGTTFLLSYSIVGNILEFSTRGTNWNAGPNSEFIVIGNEFTEKLRSFIYLLYKQAPENLYALISGIELSNSAAYFLGLGFLFLVILGILYLYKRRADYSNQNVLVFLALYGLIYFSFIFLGRLAFSPTRHLLFYLPVAVLLIGYGVIGIQNKLSISLLKVMFLIYCVSSLIGYSTFATPRMDKIHQGFFHELLKNSNASFLIFDGFDIEPIFSESKMGDPIFWFSSGGFNCSNKEILISKERKLRFITYSKSAPLMLPNPELMAYISQIIDRCTTHTIANKKINGILSKGFLIDSPGKASVEFSSRVLDRISTNNQFVYLNEIDLNFDSGLYDSSLSDGIDFSHPSYPRYLKYVSGLSHREDWGRWTDSNLGEEAYFGFIKPLPKKFILEIKAIPFGPNISKPTIIKVGTEEKTIIVDGKQTTFYLEFENFVDADAIQIKAPSSKLKSPLLHSHDARNLGVGLIYLKIKDSNKLPL